MENKNLFNDEIKEKFNRFSSRMYNLKHSLNFFLSCLEDETEPNLELICFCYILGGCGKGRKMTIFRTFSTSDLRCVRIRLGAG